MPNHAHNLEDVEETSQSVSRHNLQCIVCERRIDVSPGRGTEELMIRCRRCGTLQHRRIGQSSGKRPREK